MARFKQTLENLQAIARLMPTASAAPATPAAGISQNALEKMLIRVLQKEDDAAQRIALLVNKLITKYKGRAVS